jgi:hypothetical protein
MISGVEGLEAYPVESPEHEQESLPAQQAFPVQIILPGSASLHQQ